MAGRGDRAFLKLGGGRVVYRLEDIERYEAEQLRDSTTAPLRAARLTGTREYNAQTGATVTGARLRCAGLRP